MKMRFNFAKVAPGVYDAMDALDPYIGQTGLPADAGELPAGGGGGGGVNGEEETPAAGQALWYRR